MALTLQISLPEVVAAQLTAKAAERGMTPTEYARSLVTAGFTMPAPRRTADEMLAAQRAKQAERAAKEQAEIDVITARFAKHLRSDTAKVAECLKAGPQRDTDIARLTGVPNQRRAIAIAALLRQGAISGPTPYVTENRTHRNYPNVYALSAEAGQGA